MLSPLVKGPRRKGFAGSRRQRPPSGQSIPLYADTSDDGESDKGCILVLCVVRGILFRFAHFLSRNDPPSSRRPIRSIPPAKGIVRTFCQYTEGGFTNTPFIGVGQDVAKGNPLLDSLRNNAVPGCSQAARKSPTEKKGRSAHKAKEQARRQKYATELFAELNRDVFGDRLPGNTTLEWSKRLLTTAGRARWHRWVNYISRDLARVDYF